MDKTAFKIIAHRGASADAPDNSAEAFELAVAQKADLIETDVRLTADGVLVLEHDREVEGLEVQYSTLAALREVKPHLLTVAGALREFGHRVPFCFECKAANLEHALLYLVKDLVPESMWSQAEFTSFNVMSAATCQRLLHLLGDTNQVGWLTRQWDEEAIEFTREMGLAQLCPPAAAVLARPELVQTAKDAGLTVRVWLVTEPEMVPDLADAGVYGGTVNFPGEVAALLGSRGG